jgi:plastocyanin
MSGHPHHAESAGTRFRDARLGQQAMKCVDAGARMPSNARMTSPSREPAPCAAPLSSPNLAIADSGTLIHDEAHKCEVGLGCGFEEEDAMKKVGLTIALVMLTMVSAPSVRPQTAPAVTVNKEVQMTAKKYEFSPDTVEVKAGTRIICKITALDRGHGFEIANVKDSCVKIQKGETATVEYLAEKAGTVEFRCCVFCGIGHRGMKGKIVIR